MADPEATTVHMGRMGLLEVEDKAEQTRQSRVAEGPESLTKLSNFGTYRRMCGLVGADVVKIPVHKRKHEQSERNRGVQRCTRTSLICKY